MANQPKSFQINGARRLAEIFANESRAFLADEAGLGKTFTAMLTMKACAQRFFAKNPDAKLYGVLYVAPNQTVLRKCCDDFVDKYNDNREQNEPRILYLQQDNETQKIQRLGPPAQAKQSKLSLPKADVNKLTEKTILLLPTSIAVLGDLAPADSGDIRERNDWGYDSLSHLEYDILREYQFHFFIFDEYHKYFESVARNDKTIREIFMACDAGKNSADKAFADLKWEIDFDKELPQVSQQYKNHIPSILYLEKEDPENTKLLFVSATPYQSHAERSSDEKTENMAEEEDELSTLPEYGAFVNFFVSGYSRDKEKGWEIRAAEPAEEIKSIDTEEIESKLAKTIKDNSAKYQKAWGSYLSRKTEEDRQKVKELAEMIRKDFACRMIRNERTLLSGNSTKPEIHKEEGMIGLEEAADDSRIGMIRNPFQQKKVLRDLGYGGMALTWAESMPGILSFSSFYGAGAGGTRTKKQKQDYFSDLTYGRELPLPDAGKSLFCYEYETASGPAGANAAAVGLSDIVKTLPAQSVDFAVLCEKTIADGLAQMIWVPPAIPAYKVDRESIFARHADYSKMLVFAKYRVMQRGGPVLLTDYAKYVNGYFSGQNNITLEIPVLEDAEVCALAEKTDRLFESIPADQLELSALYAYAAANHIVPDRKTFLRMIASPQVCAKRLGIDKTKEVAKLFNGYFAKPSVRAALLCWLEDHKGRFTDEAAGAEDIEWGLLQYCAEGNLYAVLAEWMWVSGKRADSFLEEMRQVLSYQHSCIHVQTKRDYDRSSMAGVERELGFAERVTADKKDNGSSNAKESADLIKETLSAFNSPFYPMVIFAGNGAQEGLDFHYYCHRIMHMTIPDGAAGYDQRQGRIDRYGSHLVRRRLAEYAGMEVFPDAGRAFEEALRRMEEKKRNIPLWNEDLLFPEWQIKEPEEGPCSRFHFERYVPRLPMTVKEMNYHLANRQLINYRSVLGTSDLLKREDLKKEDIKDCIIDLSTKLPGN